MAMTRQPLWPTGGRGALLAAPLIWLALGVALGLAHKLWGWPNKDSGNTVLLLTVAVGFVPILLAVLDYIASSRAAMDIRGVKIDFSQGEVKRLTIELPPNLGQAGVGASDAAPLDITNVLDSALSSPLSAVETLASNPIIRVNLGKGDAWWVSRLLVVTAGAVRTGVPGAIAFVGDNPTPRTFFGWASPAETLASLMEDTSLRGHAKLRYSDVYSRAVRISNLLALFGEQQSGISGRIGARGIPAAGRANLFEQSQLRLAG